MIKPIIIGVFLTLINLVGAQKVMAMQKVWWEFQSVDTMKSSRDMCDQYVNDQTKLIEISEAQIKAIADTGATHVAIATPYDKEFIPVLKQWVAAARKYNLKIWFRGNFSGWEGWFNYPLISRQDHLAKLIGFITANPQLFEDGDYFSACPECENGGPGDPRQTLDVTGHRQFLIDEYNVMELAFKGIHKRVKVNMNPMNGDVANLIMDKPTTQALGGVVVIDHYVKTPEQLDKDVTDLALKSGGKVILGEFGAPIPDIHGKMNEAEQAEWLSHSLKLLSNNPNLIGLNYWTNIGGSTELWSDKVESKMAVTVLKQYYRPKYISGNVVGELGKKITDSQFKTKRFGVVTTDRGKYLLPYMDEQEEMEVSAPGYESRTLSYADIESEKEIKLSKITSGWWGDLMRRFTNWFKS